MIKKISFLLLLALTAFGAKAQKQTWKELEDFHSVMSQTFHPSEEGNLAPVKARSGELAEKAALLKKSDIPSSYQKPGVKESLTLLAKESKALDKMVRKQKPDAEITRALNALHERFHEVVEKCQH